MNEVILKDDVIDYLHSECLQCKHYKGEPCTGCICGMMMERIGEMETMKATKEAKWTRRRCDLAVCSNCGHLEGNYLVTAKTFHYCPGCGAKMVKK